MSLIFRRRVPLSRRAWLNVSGSGASLSLRLGPVTVNSRGRVTVRTPVRGLTWRGRV